MKRTYAYNGILIGCLLGVGAGAYTKNIAIGIIAAIAASVLCFLAIRYIEKLFDKGGEFISDKITGKLEQKYKSGTNGQQSGNLADRYNNHGDTNEQSANIAQQNNYDSNDRYSE